MLVRLRLLRAAALAAPLLGLALGALAQPIAPRPYPEHRTGMRCAFDSVMEVAYRHDPAARRRHGDFMRQAQTLAARQLASGQAVPDVTVPVVMHIIHAGGTSNISDAQVNDAMRIVNRDFSKTNPDTVDIIPAFQAIAANVGFRFRLAKRDPNGNCTTGITRTYSTDTNIGDDRVKNLIRWDQDRYLNVWICVAANGAGGYAYLPCTGGSGDGIVIRNAQFGSVGTSGGGNLAVRSLTHEIGHYFGLPHTWGGSNTPGLPSNCGIDDGVADTPNTIGSSGSCNAAYGGGTVLYNFNPCGPLANVQNYMDYSGCTRMFTLGQKAVMRAALTLGCRNQLSTPANLVATGTNDGYQAGLCAPVVAFRSNSATVCEGGSVSFVDESYNADVASASTVYAWQFPGGTPATSSSRTPAVAYAAGGIYSVTLAVTTAGGTGTRTQTGFVTVLGASTGLRAPIAESFETPTFPNNFPAPDLRNWALTSSAAGGSVWQRYNAAANGLVASQGAGCLRTLSGGSATGTAAQLTSPVINLSTFSAANPPVLLFDRAYARRPGVGLETLRVQISTDCGATWYTMASYLPTALNTQGSQLPGGYAPDSLSDWRTTSVPLDPADVATGRAQLRFELTYRGGNPLYLDNIRLALPTAARAADFDRAGLRLFPNPYTAETAVALTLERPGTVGLTVLDALGRAVATGTAATLAAGPHTMAVPTPAGGLKAGIYLVQVRLNGQTYANRLLVR